MPYYNPEPRFQKPARKSLSRPEPNIDIGDPRKGYDSGWRSHPKPATGLSGSSIPKVETRTPRDISPKVPLLKLLKATPLKVLSDVLTPTMTAPPAEDTYDWSLHSENIARAIARDNFVGKDLAARPQQLVEPEVELPTKPLADPKFIRPEVPRVQWFDRPDVGPYIAKSPKIGTIEYVVPDYDVPAPVTVELPERHSWFDEIPLQEIPELVREFDIPKVPDIDVNPEMLRQRKPDEIYERSVSVEITAVPNKNPMVKLRPMLVKGSTPRKNDTKAASRWIKLAHLAISLTYGTYTEIEDFVEILVWDAYRIDPKTGRLIYAMFEEEQKVVNVLNGIAQGKYSVDIAATLVDYGVSQAQDILIGKMSRLVTNEVVDTGGWRSPQGPQGFVNKMQKDYRNVLSQYETKSTDDQQRRLLSLPPLSDSPRRLWNAKSGLTTSVRG